MRTTIEVTFTKAFWFIRLGRFEAQLERQTCAAPEGWFSRTPSGITGVMMINIGRHTLHLENTKRAAKHFAAMPSNAATLW